MKGLFFGWQKLYDLNNRANFSVKTEPLLLLYHGRTKRESAEY